MFKHITITDHLNVPNNTKAISWARYIKKNSYLILKDLDIITIECAKGALSANFNDSAKYIFTEREYPFTCCEYLHIFDSIPSAIKFLDRAKHCKTIHRLCTYYKLYPVLQYIYITRGIYITLYANNSDEWFTTMINELDNVSILNLIMETRGDVCKYILKKSNQMLYLQDLYKPSMSSIENLIIV